MPGWWATRGGWSWCVCVCAPAFPNRQYCVEFSPPKNHWSLSSHHQLEERILLKISRYATFPEEYYKLPKSTVVTELSWLLWCLPCRQRAALACESRQIDPSLLQRVSPRVHLMWKMSLLFCRSFLLTIYRIWGYIMSPSNWNPNLQRFRITTYRQNVFREVLWEMWLHLAGVLMRRECQGTLRHQNSVHTGNRRSTVCKLKEKPPNHKKMHSYFCLFIFE